MARGDRFADLLPLDRIESASLSVIGVGAIGRQVAVQLAAMGVGQLQLVDHDVVEVENLGPQGFFHADVGRPKVEATAELCRALHPGCELDPLASRYTRGMPVGATVFCCVDSISTRRHIWTCVRDQVECFIDGRMAAEALRVITAADAESRSRYPSTLFAESEAHQGACTARSTIYCASIAAGLMVGQWTRWLRGMPLDADLTMNLLAGELTAA